MNIFCCFSTQNIQETRTISSSAEKRARRDEYLAHLALRREEESSRQAPEILEKMKMKKIAQIPAPPKEPTYMKRILTGSFPEAENSTIIYEITVTSSPSAEPLRPCLKDGESKKVDIKQVRFEKVDEQSIVKTLPGEIIADSVEE